MATNPPTQPASGPPASDITYETLTPEDLLGIARDALRGRESDHYRLSLLHPSSSGGPERLRALENEITSIKTEVRDLEAQVGEE